MTVGERMKARRKQIGMSAEQVADQLNISPSTVYRYENGDIEKMGIDKLTPIADALRTTPAYLMGWGTQSQPPPPNMIPLPKMREWPVLGATACGKPLHRELLDETVSAPDDIKADIVFRCVGDSMINARIFDGDAVFIRTQPEVEQGQIAVERIGDEYTLKRVYVHEDYVELRAENPTYKAIILRGKDLEEDNFEIVGLAVAFLSAIM